MVDISIYASIFGEAVYSTYLDFFHQAFTIVATEPIMSMVPLIGEIRRLRGAYNPRTLLGCVELNCVRANTVLANFLKVRLVLLIVVLFYSILFYFTQGCFILLNFTQFCFILLFVLFYS